MLTPYLRRPYCRCAAKNITASIFISRARETQRNNNVNKRSQIKSPQTLVSRGDTVSYARVSVCTSALYFLVFRPLRSPCHCRHNILSRTAARSDSNRSECAGVTTDTAHGAFLSTTSLYLVHLLKMVFDERRAATTRRSGVTTVTHVDDVKRKNTGVITITGTVCIYFF